MLEGLVHPLQSISLQLTRVSPWAMPAYHLCSSSESSPDLKHSKTQLYSVEWLSAQMPTHASNPLNSQYLQDARMRHHKRTRRQTDRVARLTLS